LKELAVLDQETRPDVFTLLFLMEKLHQPYSEALEIPIGIISELITAYNKRYEKKDAKQ
jgi:hypothetical protein